ncbi:hypothetical protein B0H13DRAFT_1927575 [Mycena leptocephala]|nr:hypothetical protein B0H13DRAFT_1927575 [Mycena leptocephala]
MAKMQSDRLRIKDVDAMVPTAAFSLQSPRRCHMPWSSEPNRPNCESPSSMALCERVLGMAAVREHEIGSNFRWKNRCSHVRANRNSMPECDKGRIEASEFGEEREGPEGYEPECLDKSGHCAQDVFIEKWKVSIGNREGVVERWPWWERSPRSIIPDRPTFTSSSFAAVYLPSLSMGTPVRITLSFSKKYKMGGGHAPELCVHEQQTRTNRSGLRRQTWTGIRFKGAGMSHLSLAIVFFVLHQTQQLVVADALASCSPHSLYLPEAEEMTDDSTPNPHPNFNKSDSEGIKAGAGRLPWIKPPEDSEFVNSRRHPLNQLHFARARIAPIRSLSARSPESPAFQIQVSPSLSCPVVVPQ